MNNATAHATISQINRTIIKELESYVLPRIERSLSSEERLNALKTYRDFRSFCTRNGFAVADCTAEAETGSVSNTWGAKREVIDFDGQGNIRLWYPKSGKSCESCIRLTFEEKLGKGAAFYPKYKGVEPRKHHEHIHYVLPL